MAVKLGEFRVDAAATQEMLTDPDGIVGALILELSERATTVARGKAHVWPGTARSTLWRNKDGEIVGGTAILPPGTMRDSVHVHPPVRGSRGGMYGGVNVNVLPSVFLEFRPKGSVQMYDRYPFMTTGIESLEGTV